MKAVLRKREVEAVDGALQVLDTLRRDKPAQRRTQVLEAVDGGGIEVREQLRQVLQGVRDFVVDGCRDASRGERCGIVGLSGPASSSSISASRRSSRSRTSAELDARIIVAAALGRQSRGSSA